ncbi:MAG: universal stress protein [Rubricoccaceae bacterium]
MLSLRTVLCALDFSDGSTRALVAAADLAERSSANLHLLHVDPLFRARLASAPGGDSAAAFHQRVKAFVNQTLGAADAFDVLAPTVRESYGEVPADGILRYAEEIGAGLVVTSTHGRRGLDHLLLGSVAAEVLRRSPVPVLVVPERSEGVAPSPDHPVLVALDVSDLDTVSLRAANELAMAYSAPLVVSHVRDVGSDSLIGSLPPSPGSRSREEAHTAIDTLLREAEISGDPELFVIPGDPKAELVALAQKVKAGALVMGTHGRTGWSRVRLGSVAEWVVRHATCPVLTLPARSASDLEAAA